MKNFELGVAQKSGVHLRVTEEELAATILVAPSLLQPLRHQRRVVDYRFWRFSDRRQIGGSQRAQAS